MNPTIIEQKNNHEKCIILSYEEYEPIKIRIFKLNEFTSQDIYFIIYTDALDQIDYRLCYNRNQLNEMIHDLCGLNIEIDVTFLNEK